MAKTKFFKFESKKKKLTKEQKQKFLERKERFSQEISIPPPKNKAIHLNTHERKELFKILDFQWGLNSKNLLKDFVFFMTPKNKIYILNKDVLSYDYHKIFSLNLNSYGIYFANKDKFGIRLTIEGSQMLGPHATKNILFLNEKLTKQWISGEDVILEDDLVKDLKEENILNTFFIIQIHTQDFFGCGRISKKKIQGKETFVLNNYIPKARRIIYSNIL